MNNIELTDEQIAKKYPLFYLVSTDKDLLNKLNKMLEKDGIIGIYDIAGRTKYILDGRDNLFKVKFRIQQVLEKHYSPHIFDNNLEVSEDDIIRNLDKSKFDIQSDEFWSGNRASSLNYENIDNYQSEKQNDNSLQLDEKVETYLNYHDFYEKIYEQNNQISKDKLYNYLEFIKKKSIEETLDKYNISQSLSAYKYIYEILFNSTTDPLKLRPLSKSVYPIIAKKYNKNVRLIERVILYGISKSGFKQGNIECLSLLYRHSRSIFDKYIEEFNNLDKNTISRIVLYHEKSMQMDKDKDKNKERKQKILLQKNICA